MLRTVVEFEYNVLRETLDKVPDWWIYYEDRYRKRLVASKRTESDILQSHEPSCLAPDVQNDNA